MKLREIYETAVRAGMAADPRGQDGVDRVLEQARKDFDDSPGGTALGVRPGGAHQPVCRHAHPGRRSGDGESRASWSASISRWAKSCWPTRCAPGDVRSTSCWLTIRKARALARLEEVMGVQADVWQELRCVARLRRRRHERAHARDHAGAASPQQREDHRRRPAARPALHVLPHPGRQQRQQLRAGALRRPRR